MGDIVANQIYCTKDYDKFKFMEGNRLVDHKHLQKIRKTLLEKQLPIPIIINENYEILEGQHRFTIIKEQNLDLFYIIIKGVTIRDAITINTINKGWKGQDYFKFYLDLGYEQYQKLNYFMEITGTNLFDARLFLEGQNNGNSTERFNTGGFEAIEFEEAFRKHEQYLDFKDAVCFNHKSFKIALMKIFTNEFYDHNRMKEQIEKGLLSELSIRANMLEYIKILTHIYNVNKTKKNLVHFNVDCRGNVLALKM